SVSGLPVASIMSQANGVLSNVQAGELAQGVPVTVIYSSGQFIITAGDARAKATSLSAAWVSNAAIDPVTTTGTATAYAATSPVLSYADGIEVVVVPHVTSGASPTLALNGLAATAIKYYAGGVLAAVPPGALMIGVPARLVYTSGAWVLLSPRWAVGGDVATVGSVVDASGFIASTKAAANAGGAAPIYAIRARIAFSVSGGVITVMQADNMAVTRSLPGVFAATFTTDMQDANYVVQGCATGDLSASVSRMFTPNLTNNGTAFSLVAPVAHGFSFCTTNTGALIDPTYCYITVSR
ncbi:MAG: hypothetical protein KGL35_30210, partial [Bradyrhizobium sp.]|nr:hypothetical protein [Bradyrhizobium sp.]